MAKKERADKLLVERGLVESREKAQALIMAGYAYADGKRISKPGERIPADARLELKGMMRFVSRGGYKLEKALKSFNLSPEGMVCLDAGASTGGFTDCLLQRGAKKVYAVDVGTGQLDPKLRNDPRVVALEKTDARNLSPELIPERVDLITADLSFISLTKVLESLIPLLKEGGLMLVLVKPQFELSPREVKKGVVRDPADRMRAVEKVANFARELGLSVLGVTKSSPRGPKGNEEFFLLLKKDREGRLPQNWEEALRRAIEEKVSSRPEDFEG